MKTNTSKKIFKNAQKYLVGGVNSPVRAFNAVGGQALVMSHGKGAKFTDVDGNTFTDYCLSWGSLILGHKPPTVYKALQKQIKNGTSFGTSTEVEGKLAQFICKQVKSIEQIRFVNSGTEATMSAIRLARGYTGKDKVLKFDGCYHGHVDDLLTTAGSGVANLAQSSSKGIPKAHVQNTLSIPYNDVKILQQTLKKYHKSIACVILEPVSGNMGIIVPSKAFLKELRRLTKAYNIVLIFDEIMTGFRTSLHCAQKELDITPDMTCLGKTIGGGFPIGAYGGKKAIMQHLAPLGAVYQAGTFSGNPVVLAAGLATLKVLKETNIKKNNARCAKLAQKLNLFFKKNNLPVHLSYFHSMMSLRFRKESVANYADATQASSDQIYAKLFHFLLSKGIYLPPADLESFFISLAHTDKDLLKLEKALQSFFIGEQHG